MFKFPSEVKFISSRLKNVNFQCFAVGGCIRDQLIGKEPKDFDLVTDASPEQIHKIFDGQIDRVMDLGAAFNITTLVMNGKPFEIAQMRTDIGGNGRHPEEIEFTRDIELDLGRRDFAMNAIAWDLQREILRDPFAGSMDIDDKIIDFVGEPEKRIEEDYLRILRAFRFKSQLGFKFSENTYYAIEKYCNAGPLGKFQTALHDGTLSQERITAEFSKILTGNNAFETISMMASLGLLFEIIPDLNELLMEHNNSFHTETFGEFGNTIFAHTMHVFKAACDIKLSDKENLILRLAALFHDIGKKRTMELRANGTSRYIGHDRIGAGMTESILIGMKFDCEVRDKAAKLVSRHMNGHDLLSMRKVNKIRRFLGDSDFELIFNLCLCDILGTSNKTGTVPNINDAEIFCIEVGKLKEKYGTVLPEPLIDGKKLINAGAVPGPEFKTALYHAYNLQLDGEDREQKLLNSALAEIKFLRSQKC